ncbi:MAG: amino acid adenylation domain-containing protein, partial [Chloroflexi bacterium]
DMPFELLVEALQPRRDLSRNPLFQVAFSFHDSRMPALDLPGVRGEVIALTNGNVKFDIDVIVIPQPQQRFELEGSEAEDVITVLWGAQSDVFDAETLGRMVGHYERVLERLVSEPGLRASEVRLLGEAERRQVVEGWNRTETSYGDQGWLPELVSAQAGRTPGAVAVESESGRLTYQELEQRSNRVARALRGRGVGPESVVGLGLERSPEQVVALLGILKAGAAYLPLEGVAEERRAYLQADAGVDLVLEALPEDASAEPVESLVRGENAAYVLYTSGSTGEPKGVLVSHRALRNRMLGMQAEHRLEPAEGVLVKTSLGFDVSVWEVLWPLLAGARLVLARPGGQADSGYLADLVRERQVTTAHFVPGMLRAFVEEPASAACTSLRRVLCGGESLSAELRDRFCERLPHCQLHHLYGPTEATIDVTGGRCLPAQGPGLVPIGRPLGNTRLYVLDPGLEPAPIGVVGELYIGGVQLARGYLGRPGQTADRFLPDPFVPGERLYRSGDLARWRADGALEYAGRTDEQVKVRGVRVEPGEVERVLERHPGVRQAAVVSRPDGSGQRMLAGYVTAAAQLSEEELREHLRRRLPEQSVPAWLAVLEELPRLPSGKVDRRALADLEVAPQAARPAYQAPRDQLEARLAAIWSEVLGRQDVGVHDDFFGLGGHSLLATRAVARVRDALAVQVPLRLLFDEPTVAGFATALALAPRAHPPLLPAGRRADREDDLPLSFAQERTWVLTQLEPGNPYFNVDLAVSFSGPLDAGALDASLRAVVERHEVLRASVVMVDGRPIQLIRPLAGAALLRVEDMSGLAGAEREALVREAMREEAARPFDLAGDLASWRRRTAPWSAAPRRPSPRCRSGTRTSRAGSESGSPARRSTTCWRAGGRAWTARRRS